MRIGLSFTLVSLLMAAAVAGCLNASVPSPPAGPPTAILPYLLDEFPVEVDHDHADAALHAVVHNIHPIGTNACRAEGDTQPPVGGFTDIAFHDPYIYVGNGRGFCVLDATEPAMPKFLAQYTGEHSSDLEVSEDGRFVFLLTQRNRPNDLLDPPAAPTSNTPRGVTVVNVVDPAKPTFESYYPVPTNGVHTATPYKMDGRQLLFVQTYDWVPPGELQPTGVPAPAPSNNAPATQRVEVTELQNVGGKAVLQRIGIFSQQRPIDDPLVQWFPHDSFAQKHPVTGKHLLYIAYWDAGLVIVDVSDPTSPKGVSRYADIAPSIYNQYHDVKVFPELIDGRHITVTGPELGSGPEAGMVRIFDTTDPAMPKQLSTWRLPGNPGTPGGYLYSPHVFTLNEGRIYIGHNHGGVWVIDVSDAEHLAAPVTVGFHFPDPQAVEGVGATRMSVWGAYVHNGLVYATEASSGVHVLHFAGDAMTPKA